LVCGWVASQDPDRVRGIVIGNTWAWPLRGARRYEVFSWIMGGPVGRFLAWAVNFVWWFFMKEGFVHRPTKQEMDMYRAPFLDRRNRRQTSIFPRQLVQSLSLRPKWKRISTDSHPRMYCSFEVPMTLHSQRHSKRGSWRSFRIIHLTDWK
jgi:pimeloyl-ACP methyl ester carboxylesterase